MRDTLAALAILMGWAASPVAADCDPIAGLGDLLRPGAVIVFGEMHGTRESPTFVLDAVCHAVTAGHDVIVGLELPTSEQARINLFLASGGGEADRAALLEGPRWQSDYQDGRTSVAMLELLDGLRRLRAGGHEIRVVPFDTGTAGGGQARDIGMGQALAAEAMASPQAITIGLTGNLHSRATRGRPRDVDYEPMAYVMAQALGERKLVTLDVGYGDGSAWICSNTCGVVELRGRHGDDPWSIAIDDASRPAGHTGRYFVGGITASPPARAGDTRIGNAVDNEATARMSDALSEESAVPTVPPKPTGDLTRAEKLFQGSWQSYDYASDSRTWRMRFTGRDFRAEGGADDWYEGFVTVRDDTSPAQVDFTIEDCLCDFKGTTSSGIFYREDGTIVVAAPRPGAPRPTRFNPQGGEMLRLRPLETAEPRNP